MDQVSDSSCWARVEAVSRLWIANMIYQAQQVTAAVPKGTPEESFAQYMCPTSQLEGVRMLLVQDTPLATILQQSSQQIRETPGKLTTEKSLQVSLWASRIAQTRCSAPVPVIHMGIIADVRLRFTQLNAWYFCGQVVSGM